MNFLRYGGGSVLHTKSEGSWRPGVPSLVSMVWKESDVAVKTESSIQDGKLFFYNSTPSSSTRKKRVTHFITQ